MIDAYIKKIWHRGYADWAWQVAVDEGIYGPSPFAKGSASNRAEANADIAAAIAKREAEASAKWVTVKSS